MSTYAEANQAIVVTPFLLMGAMSPVTIPAALVQQTVSGALEMTARADTLWRAALESYEPPPIDEGIREELYEYAARRRRELGTEGAKSAPPRFRRR